MGENRSGLTGGVRSPRSGEEVRQKGNANSKLLQENRHLMERLEALLKELEGEKQEKIQVMRQNKQLEKDLQVARENEAKLSRKVKTSVPMEDYNQMRKDYELEKERREAAAGQHAKIKQEYDSLIEELNETKQRLNDATIHANSQRLREREKEREREKPRQILPSAYDSPNESKLSHRLPEAIVKE